MQTQDLPVQDRITEVQGFLLGCAPPTSIPWEGAVGLKPCRGRRVQWPEAQAPASGGPAQRTGPTVLAESHAGALASPALDPDRLNWPEWPPLSSGPAQHQVASGNTRRGPQSRGWWGPPSCCLTVTSKDQGWPELPGPPQDLHARQRAPREVKSLSFPSPGRLSQKQAGGAPVSPALTGRDHRHRILGVSPAAPAGGLEAGRTNTPDIPGAGTAPANHSGGPR